MMRRKEKKMKWNGNSTGVGRSSKNDNKKWRDDAGFDRNEAVKDLPVQRKSTGTL
jgi:hypothetical protein